MAQEVLNIILFRIPANDDRLVSLFATLGSDEKYNIETVGNLQEFQQYFNMLDSCLLLFGVTGREDLIQILSLLNAEKQALKGNNLRVAGFLYLNNNRVEEALKKAGVADILDPAIKDRTLIYKFGIWGKVLRPKAKKGTQEVTRSDDQFIEVLPPLELEEDCWIVKSPQDCKKVLKKYMLRLLGPSPSLGKWDIVEKKGMRSLWRFSPRNLQLEGAEHFFTEQGEWIARSEQKPEFDWRINRWIFLGENICLYFQPKNNSQEQAFRFQVVDSRLHIAKNSDFALTKEELIAASFDQEYEFGQEEEEEKNSEARVEKGILAEIRQMEEMEASQGKEAQAGNLEGKSSTDKLNNGLLKGKATTDQLGQNHLDGKSQGADQLGPGHLKGKNSGDSALGGNLTGHQSGESSLSGNLEGRQTGQEKQAGNLKGTVAENQKNASGPLSGKVQAERGESGPLAGQVKPQDAKTKGAWKGGVQATTKGKGKLEGQGEKADHIESKLKGSLSHQIDKQSKGPLEKKKAEEKTKSAKTQDPYAFLMDTELNKGGVSDDAPEPSPQELEQVLSFMDVSPVHTSLNKKAVIPLEKKTEAQLQKEVDDILGAVFDENADIAEDMLLDFGDGSRVSLESGSMSLVIQKQEDLVWRDLELPIHLEEYFEGDLTLRVEGDSDLLAKNQTLRVLMDYKYALKDVHLNVRGQIKELVPLEEGEFVITLGVKNMDEKAYAEFQTLYLARQSQVFSFLKKARGM